MYARATSGDKFNNNKFSICSIRNISAVLTKKRDDCFVGKFSVINILCSCLCVRESLSLHCYVCVQSLASQSVVMDLWKLEKRVTAAIVISVKIPAAIAPMKRRAKSANSDLAKSAGNVISISLYGPVIFVKLLSTKNFVHGVEFVWLLIVYLCGFAVPAKVHVAQQSVHSRVQMRSADWTPSVPKRANAMELLPCALLQNQRKTSPLAMQQHKSASMGYVSFSSPFYV